MFNPSNPSAGTATENCETCGNPRHYPALFENCIEWHALTASARPMSADEVDKLRAGLISARKRGDWWPYRDTQFALCETVIALRSQLAKREAECAAHLEAIDNALSVMRDPMTLADAHSGRSQLTLYYVGAKKRQVKRARESASAAVAPAARETQETNDGTL